MKGIEGMREISSEIEQEVKSLALRAARSQELPKPEEVEFKFEMPESALELGQERMRMTSERVPRYEKRLSTGRERRGVPQEKKKKRGPIKKALKRFGYFCGEIATIVGMMAAMAVVGFVLYITSAGIVVILLTVWLVGQSILATGFKRIEHYQKKSEDLDNED